MATLNCTACGSKIKYKKGESYLKCKHCGKEIFLSREKIVEEPEKVALKKRKRLTRLIALGLVGVIVFSALIYFLVGLVRGIIVNSQTEDLFQTFTEYTQERLPNGYEIEGEYVYYGFYPQTIKKDGVRVGTKPDEKGYLTGTDGEKYAKVLADPYKAGYTYSNGESVKSKRSFYFKVEPIKWRILESDNGEMFIVCNSIIANYHYDKAENIYASSEIKKWLNEKFFATAFSSKQQALINDPTENIGKIFLLSYNEATNESYGFATGESTQDGARLRQTTDYSRATGAFMSTEQSTYGNGYWWLRVPPSGYDNYIFCGFADGYITKSYDYNDWENGVVPALKLNIAQ